MRTNNKWNGKVRQQGEYEGIPHNHLAHMTGGLPKAIINIGVLGVFNEFPLLYVIGGGRFTESK